MVPLVLEEIFITQADKSKHNIKHKKSLKNVVQNEKFLRSCQKQNNAIDKSKQYEKVTDNFIPSAFDYLFKSEASVY
jgi:hypothetical protein